MSKIAQFLPWQEEIAARWLANTERFAHAWLIHGLPGIGKRYFVRAAAAALLCEDRAAAKACQVCQACRWLAAGNHPDFRLVRPDAIALAEGDGPEETASSTKSSPSREIRLEQLRVLSDWFGMATHRGGWRVIVIYPADAMNHFTANALLKVLEEPPPHTLFLLAADAPDRLLPTIVSRCRRLPLPVPERSASLAWLSEKGVSNSEEWLAAAGGAPLRALEAANAGGAPCPAWLSAFFSEVAAGKGGFGKAVLAATNALNGVEPIVWLDILQRAFFDLSLVAVGAAPRYFPSEAPIFRRVAAQASPVTLADVQRWLAEQRRIASHPLSAGLFVHSVLQRCAHACITR